MGQAGSPGTLADQNRAGRAGSGAIKLGARDWHDPAANTCLVEDRLGELRPAALAASGDVVGAVWELDDVTDGCRQVLDVRGAPPLVGDHAHLVPLLPEGEHRPNEVLSRRAEEPGASDDPAFFDLPLSLELRLAVDGQRIGLVGLDVRLALRTVEDVIGGEVDDRRAHGDDVPRTKHVDALDRSAL